MCRFSLFIFLSTIFLSLSRIRLPTDFLSSPLARIAEFLDWIFLCVLNIVFSACFRGFFKSELDQDAVRTASGLPHVRGRVLGLNA